MPSEYACAFFLAACVSPTRSRAAGDPRRSRVRAGAVPVGGVEAAQVLLAGEERRERRPLDERADARQHRLERLRASACRAPGTRRRLAASSPSSIRIVVVLPEPFGPRKPKTAPRGTARSIAVDGESARRSAWSGPASRSRGRSPAGAGAGLGRSPAFRQRPVCAASTRRAAGTAPASTRPSSVMSTLTSEVCSTRPPSTAVGDAVEQRELLRVQTREHVRAPASLEPAAR